MRRRAVVLGAFIGSILAVGACSSAMGGGAPANEGQSLIRRWEEAAATRNAATLVTLYAEDAAGLYAYAPARMGRDSIRVAWEQFFRDSYLDVTPRRVEVSPDGNMAYSTGRYEVRTGSPTGAVAEAGKYLQVWKKVNGEWRVIADMNNADSPPQ